MKFLAIAVATWVACLIWLNWFDPEQNFYRAAFLNKQAWARKLDAQYESKIIVYGGSSSAFALNGGGLLKHHHLPVLNMGMHAGMGAEMLTQFALSETRPGDTLVIALEPGLLTAPFSPSPLASKLSLTTRHPQWLEQPWLAHPLPWSRHLMQLRPGGMYVVTMCAKFVARAPLYRYSKNDLHDGGWMTTAERRPFASGPPSPLHLSPDGRKLLAWLSNWCRQHQIRVAYLPPRQYVDARYDDKARLYRLMFLEEISEWVPVLGDPQLGVHHTLEDFADTGNHLRANAAMAYSEEFAAWVKEWKVWETPQLQAMLPASDAQPSYNGAASR